MDHRTQRTHAPIGLVRATLEQHTLARTLVESGQQATQHLGTTQEANSNGSENGDQAGHDHFLDGRGGGNVHTAPEVGLGGALHQTGDLPELAAHLFDHRKGRTAHHIHGET